MADAHVRFAQEFAQRHQLQGNQDIWMLDGGSWMLNLDELDILKPELRLLTYVQLAEIIGDFEESQLDGETERNRGISSVGIHEATVHEHFVAMADLCLWMTLEELLTAPPVPAA